MSMERSFEFLRLYIKRLLKVFSLHTGFPMYLTWQLCTLGTCDYVTWKLQTHGDFIQIQQFKNSILTFHCTNKDKVSRINNILFNRKRYIWTKFCTRNVAYKTSLFLLASEFVPHKAQWSPKTTSYRNMWFKCFQLQPLTLANGKTAKTMIRDFQIFLSKIPWPSHLMCLVRYSFF